MEQYYQFLTALLSKINGLLIKIAVSLKIILLVDFTTVVSA